MGSNPCISRVKDQKETELFQAIISNNNEYLKKSIQNLDPSTLIETKEGKMTAPELAVRLSSVESLRHMYNTPGYDVIKNKKGKSLIHLSIKVRSFQVLQFYCEECTKQQYNTKKFLPQPINVGKVIDKKGRNLLLYACEKGDIQIVKYLIQLPFSEFKLGATDLQGNNTLLLAAKAGNMDTLPYLIAVVDEIFKYGTGKNMTILYHQLNYFGDTILHIAARNRKLFVIKYLVEVVKLDIQTPNKKGQSILELAKEMEYDQLEEYCMVYYQQLIIYMFQGF